MIVLATVAAFLVSQAALAAAIEYGPAWLRDPEFAAKEERLSTKPNGSIHWVAFGSSRLVEGVRPAVLAEADRHVFNFGLIGAGPVQERLALRRLLRSGMQPSAVLLEYWPPYLLDFADSREEDRLDRERLDRRDLPDIELYVRDPVGLASQFHMARLVPAFSHRFVFLNLALAVWLPFEKRQEFRWRPLDEWGWLPGKVMDPSPAARVERLRLSRQYYQPFLSSSKFDAVGERAVDDLLDDCRAAGIAVVVIWLPESSEFRSWYSPSVERMAQERCAGYGTRPGIRLINARAWISDERLGDGFHLDPAGATEFTRRLAAELDRGPR